MFPCSDLCIFNNLNVLNELIIDYLYFTVCLAEVLTDIRYVFAMYLINLDDTNRRQWILFLNQVMILMFCIFKSLIGTDMTYAILTSMCR